MEEQSVKGSLGGPWRLAPEQTICREEPSGKDGSLCCRAVGPEGVPWPLAEVQSQQHAPFPPPDPARLLFTSWIC